MGLRATASERFSVSDLWVPGERSFRIHPDAATLPGIVYQYPFLQFAEATLAVNSLGMARHFLESVQKWIHPKLQKEPVSAPVSQIRQKWLQADRYLQELRGRFYAAVDDSWNLLLKQGAVPEAQLARVSRQSRLLARYARKMVAHLYPYCGVSATQNGTELNQVFRDIFTASQHLLLNIPD